NTSRKADKVSVDGPKFFFRITRRWGSWLLIGIQKQFIGIQSTTIYSKPGRQRPILNAFFSKTKDSHIKQIVVRNQKLIPFVGVLLVHSTHTHSRFPIIYFFKLIMNVV